MPYSIVGINVSNVSVYNMTFELDNTNEKYLVAHNLTNRSISSSEEYFLYVNRLFVLIL